MKKSSFDFEFSSQANNKKSFAQKMQNERKQRLENKKQQSSALKILHFYRQSVQYASFSELLSKEYMSKLLDLMKIESIVKEKFPLLAKAALDKFNFLRISLLITPTNGEKYYPLMEKLIYLIYITTKKEDIPNITRKIHIKRIAMGLFGMINRGFSPQNSHIDDFFILASKIKGLEIEQKLLRSLLKGRKYNEKMIPILKRITKTILLKSQNSSKKEKEILLFELLLIPNGIANFSPKKIHTLLEMAISQMFGLVKFLKNIKKNEICSISFTNLLQILMKISLEDTILNISFLPLLNGLNQILDLMTGDLENTIMGSQIEIEEENKTMEVEMDIESELQIFQKADNFLVEEQHFDTIMHLDYFFSDEMIGFISKQMKSQLEKKQIFNAHDWELLKNVCHFYTKLLQMKTGSKSRFLLKLSLSSQFIEMLFEIFEIFVIF